MVEAVMLPATLEDACGEEPGSVCEWVYDETGDETLAKLANWLVDKPLQIILVLLVAWIVARLAKRWVRRAVRRLIVPDRSIAAKQFRKLGIEPPPVLDAEVSDPRRETRALVISTVVAGGVVVITWTIAIVSIADILGIALGPLIASAGIAGVALGFGAQSLVKDWIAGLFMLIEDHYGIGDVVDLGEASGVVERFSLRATVLRSADGTVWHVPNGVVVRVGNRSQLWSVALIDVIVSYDADIERARTVLHETAAAVCARPEFADKVLEPPEVLGVENMSVEGVTLRATVKTSPGQQWAVQRALREAVKGAFDANSITMPIAFAPRSIWSRVEPDQPPPAGGPATA